MDPSQTTTATKDADVKKSIQQSINLVDSNVCNFDHVMGGASFTDVDIDCILGGESQEYLHH